MTYKALNNNTCNAYRRMVYVACLGFLALLDTVCINDIIADCEYFTL